MTVFHYWEQRYNTPGAIYPHKVPGVIQCDWCKLKCDTLASVLPTYPGEGELTQCTACNARGVITADGIKWDIPGDEDMKDRYIDEAP